MLINKLNGGKKNLGSVTFAYFHGINTPTMFNLQYITKLGLGRVTHGLLSHVIVSQVQNSPEFTVMKQNGP